MYAYRFFWVLWFLALSFRTLFHFELIFYTVWSMGSGSLFSKWISSCSILICWKTFLFLLNCLGTFVENQFTINVWFIPLIYMQILDQYYTPDHCCVVVSSKIGKCEVYNLVLFHDCFSYSWTLALSYEI